MARLNTSVKTARIYTAEGATACRINPELQLRRLVMSCMLFEEGFYIDGQSVADLIGVTIAKVPSGKVALIAVEAREQMKLRHVPLLIVREMARLATHKALVAETLARVIQRADELTEFLAIYWKDGRCPLSTQVKKGLAAAFQKFTEYDLQKYNRDEAIKLRDVLFLCHAKPGDEAQADLWKRLIDNKLTVPDTWETALSATKGEGKREVWERLLKENKLGALALLRNLRNMQQESVNESLIRNALANIKTERVLPFRFIAAARYNPALEPDIEPAMLKCCEGQEKLPGKTILLLDVSGSMEDKVSGKSDISRMDAGAALGILLREICESVRVITFSNEIIEIPARRGFALRDAIVNSQPHSSTYLGQAVGAVNAIPHDRLIVVTDEQSHDTVGAPAAGKSYLINVATNQNGIGYGKWLHIDGWSEAVIDFIRTVEGGFRNETA